MEKRLIDMMAEALKQNGYDGLVSPMAECGCLVDEGGLAPCGECWCGCDPGYRGPGDQDLGQGEWAVYQTKEHRDTAARRIAKEDAEDAAGHCLTCHDASGRCGHRAQGRGGE